MNLIFSKYHGTGNDFILVDNRDDRFKPDEKLIAGLCHRRFGVGADGLITLNDATGFDFRMKYYNSDGKESTMCGNGGRCMVAFADFLSLSKGTFRFIAADGEHAGSVLEKDGDVYMVKISMNDVPGYHLMNRDFILDTGSPHLVRFVSDIEILDVVREGRALRNLDVFQPGGINVNFVEDRGGELFVRTYERGVEDETLSCGTGVTASALAFAATRNPDEGKIHVVTRGGALDLHFRQKDKGFTDIWLEGPAVKVFQGNMEI
jgi:diaminopimelate epimerase